MNIRRFVKRSLDNKKKLFLILLIVTAVTGVSAVTVQLLFGKSSVYRDEFVLEAKPTVNIKTAGMPVEIAVWNGGEIKVECIAELPLIIDETDEFGEYGKEVTISQDDGFAVSIFTFDLFRYKLKVFLPREFEFKEINIVSVSGNITVNSHHLKSGIVGVGTKSGNVNVIRATCVYSINTKSGDVLMDFDYLESSVVIETDSGNVEVRLPDYEAGKAESKLRVTTESGRFAITEKDADLPENYPLL